MPDYRGMFDRDYIGSWDLPGDVIVTISEVKAGEVTGPIDRGLAGAGHQQGVCVLFGQRGIVQPRGAARLAQECLASIAAGARMPGGMKRSGAIIAPSPRSQQARCNGGTRTERNGVHVIPTRRAARWMRAITGPGYALPTCQDGVCHQRAAHSVAFNPRPRRALAVW